MNDKGAKIRSIPAEAIAVAEDDEGNVQLVFALGQEVIAIGIDKRQAAMVMMNLLNVLSEQDEILIEPTAAAIERDPHQAGGECILRLELLDGLKAAFSLPSEICAQLSRKGVRRN